MFSVSRRKNACKMLADLCPQNCAQTAFRSRAGLWPNFGHSRSKLWLLCPILCRLRTKLCPNFGRSRARLCPISFAPCPFPNLAGIPINCQHLRSCHRVGSMCRLNQSFNERKNLPVYDPLVKKKHVGLWASNEKHPLDLPPTCITRRNWADKPLVLIYRDH